jgi:hypothetical protein
VFEPVTSRVTSVESLADPPLAFSDSEMSLLIDDARSAVLEALRAPRLPDVAVHPLGFVRVRIDDGVERWVRVHIWAPRLFGPTSPYRIHTHSFSAFSVVLGGELQNSVYRPARSTSRRAARFRVGVPEPGSTSNAMTHTARKVVLALDSERTLQRGEAYAMHRGVFHSSLCLADVSITLFVQLRHTDGDDVSQVAVPDSTAYRPAERFDHRQPDGNQVRTLVRMIENNL